MTEPLAYIECPKKVIKWTNGKLLHTLLQQDKSSQNCRSFSYKVYFCDLPLPRPNCLCRGDKDEREWGLGFFYVPSLPCLSFWASLSPISCQNLEPWNGKFNEGENILTLFSYV